MTRFAVRSAATAAAILLLVGPSVAQPPELPPALKRVPADAALFGYLDVAAVWPSKLGDTFRSAMTPELKKILDEIKTTTGITPEMVKSIAILFPQLKQPGDFEAPVFHIAFLKPYDKDKVVAAMKKQLSKDDQVKETEPGVYALIPKKDRGRENTENIEQFTIVLTDPMSIVVAGRGAKKYLTDQKTKDGPIAPAIQAAAKGATAVFGLNFAALPDEIRGDEVPAEVRPFQPLFRCDALIATGKLDGDTIKFDIRFRSQERAKTIEAEKSLGAGLFLAQTAMDAAIKQLEKSKTPAEKGFVPVAKEVAAALKTVKIAVEGPDAVATGTLKTDLPYGPLVRELIGGSSNPSTAAARATSQNNLKQIALALHNYHDANGALPPAMLVDTRGKPMLSWRVMILPYVEQSNLYQKFKLDEPWDSPHNKKVFEENPMPGVFALPGVSKEGEKTTYYQSLVGNGAMFDAIRTTKFAAITDGLSNTIMVATAAKAVPWSKPDDIQFDPKVDPKALLHLAAEGCSVALGDGSVRFLAKTIDATVLKAMITRNGGEVIALDP